MSGIMSVFVGSASEDKLQLTNTSLTDVNNGSAYVAYFIASTGVVQLTPGGNFENWVTPATSAFKYDVTATLLTGSVSGTFGTPLNLSTGRQWFVLRSTVGTTTGSIRLDLCLTGTSTVLDTATINFTATYQSG